MSGPSPEEVTHQLTEDASRLWGRERAEAIQPVLGQMAESLWLLSQHPPDRELEPAFFL